MKASRLTFCTYKNFNINFCLDSMSLSTVAKSSRPDVFCKKGVLRNFAKFTGKHLYQSLFFNKEPLAQVFSC